MKTLSYVAILGAVAALASCRLDGKYTVGGIVTGLRGTGLVLEDNSGSDLSFTASGTFTFGKSVSTGHTYAVTVRTQPSNPTQTCTVQNGSGTIDKRDVTNVVVNCTQAGRFAYVANQSANNISAFSIDATTGALSAIAGSPFASTGSAPVAVAVDPNGTFLYVANNASNNVTVYAINDATGVLTPAGVAIATGQGPSAIAIDPTDHFLYVANSSDNTVSAFAIGSSGVATAISGSPFAVGRKPIALRTDPSGNFVYVADFTDGNVAVLSIDPASGALTSISASPFGAGVGVGADSIAIDPTGAFAYVANETAATISSYTVNSSTGALTAVSGSPLSTGSAPESLAVDPAGKFVYAANVTSKNEVATYAVTAGSGALTLMATSGAGSFPLSIAVDPMGQFVYAANDSSGNVSVFTVDAATGTLAAVAGSPFSAGGGARSIAID
ncbi:MAG TPA: beta-propeller fold lactonase family protein [Steroidobacteraceae bacterium]|nr:beta-propeller fold lactonase family protein [Steroidobacteraceae bacterium]